MLIFFVVLFSVFAINSGENKYRLCAPETIDDSTCNSLYRGGGVVQCVRVTDSAECAIKLNEGKADFGVFDAEELLLAYQFYPDDFTPLAQLRQTDRLNEDWKFQSVVVVPSDYNVNEGVSGLKKSGLCHPGFSHTQIWNDYILKFLEHKTYEHKCNPELTVGENEAENIRNFFGSACRPGDWVLEATEDKKLKEKYPELCQLCDDQKNCKYDNKLHHGHMGALECLTSGRGKVAYVAYEYVLQYFNINGSNPASIVSNGTVQPGFQFLCPQGTLQPLTQSNPCAWIRQPWGTILARNDVASPLVEDLKTWLPMDSRTPSDAWLIALNKILQEDSKSIYFSEPISLRNYLVNGREVDSIGVSACGNEIRWCTLNPAETNKCNWTSKEAALLGIEPRFSCREKNSTVDCLRDIRDNKSDIITIDSNDGHLARQKYNLTSILFTETQEDKNSRVIAILRDNNSNIKIKNFNDIKGKYICFPEYGGISWLSFINAARLNKIIPETCDYADAVAKLVTAACTPGIRDDNYSDVADKNPETLDTLCSICPSEVGSNKTCSAGRVNEYFGEKGVFKCLEGSGDIGFVELKNIKKFINKKMIDPNGYRVLCRNGSLAGYTGFDVDDNCALSVTIDSEVVGRRENPRVQTIDTTLALLKIEDWLGYRPDSRRAIRIYDSFTNESDLLFKDSTIGLEAPDSNIKSVLAYKELFSKIETCRSSTTKIISSFFTIFIVFIASFLVTKVNLY